MEYLLALQINHDLSYPGHDLAFPGACAKALLSFPIAKQAPAFFVSDSLSLANDLCKQSTEQVNTVLCANDGSDLTGNYCANAFSQ